MGPILRPLRFQPIYRDYLWGGTRLAERYGRRDAPGRCAESWEIAARPDGDSVVLDGPLAGRSLTSLQAEFGAALSGSRCVSKRFPLLIKLIDARERLSVQVHPDESCAREHGGEAKTEAWYLLDAAPDSVLYAGLRPGTGPRIFHDAMRERRLPSLLRSLPAVAGRTLFVPAGTLHAIGAGCLILEVQQNSNTTYRVHDWERTGPDGRPRELKLRQAAQAIRWNAPLLDLRAPVAEKEVEGDVRRFNLLRSDFFALDQTRLQGETTVPLDGTSLQALFVEEGAARIRWDAAGPPGSFRLCRGQSCLVPAALPCYHLSPEPGSGATLLTVSLP